jgi:aryl-alcohol dehydrogenase-like predicted oxidoreductase
MIPWLIERKRTDVILSSYNFTMAPIMDTLLEQASKAGIGVVAMKVMAGGFRSNKPGTDPQVRPNSEERTRRCRPR